VNEIISRICGLNDNGFKFTERIEMKSPFKKYSIVLKERIEEITTG
jgi:hypothetical protein